MGISFNLSKIGKRFRPKSVPQVASEEEAQKDAVNVTSQRKSVLSPYSVSARKFTEKVNENKGIAEISDREVSFTLILFPNGYTVRKPLENESSRQPFIEVPKFLHPYDRTSETLFSAIESGHLPGDILDDIPCKYVDGTLVCEVRDYRNCYPESEHSRMASGEGIPIINRVCLRMSLENVVKDIPAISKSGWTYGDMMEVESRILRALQPQLYLDPTPQLDRLSDNNLVTAKLNLALSSMRRKRLRQVSDVSVFSTDNIHLKKACTDRVPDCSRLGDSGPLVQQPTHENLSTQNNVSSTMLPRRNNSFGSDGLHMDSLLVSSQSKFQIGDASPRNLKDHRSGALLNSSAASPVGQGMIPFSDNGAASTHGKRENPDGQSSPLTNKKSKLLHMGVEGNPQHTGTKPDNIHGSDLHWKNTLMQQQSIARGIQYTNNGTQKFSQQVFEGGLIQEGSVIPFSIGQQGLRYGLKEEPVETERLDKPELSRMHMGESDSTRIESQQSRLQQRMSQQFMRSGFPQPPWNNFGQPLENSSRKEDSLQKRKFVQSPRLSAGGLPQSPLSSKSGEFSSGSIGPQFGGVVTSGLISSQKDKSAVTSVPSVGVGGNPSLTSSANESMQRQNQAQAAAKRRSNSLPKTPAISGVGSPASVSNMSVPINASSPSVGNQPLADQIILERFSKIEMVSMRCQLHRKKSKVDEYPIRKHNTFSSQQLLLQLSSDSSNGNLNDEMCKMPLSKSLVGGHMNVLKTRILNFLQTERVIQGSGVEYVPKARTRMIMTEKPNDAVAYCIGEIEDDEYLDGEDYLPTLPNTHAADLLAAQFCSLMGRDGYHMEDHVQPKPVRTSNASINQLNAPGIPPGSSASEMQQFSGAFGQPLNDISKPSNSVNASVNSMQSVQGPRMLPPGNDQTLQISHGLMPGVSLPSIPQQPEQPPAVQQQPQPQPQQRSLMQQQHPQFQRSPMVLPPNSMQHLNNIAQNANMQVGGPMANKPSSIQLQMLQQQQQPLQPQQQQQQQAQMQRKIMTVGMSNIGNNMVGLGGLGNSGMGIGGVRGAGGTPMGPISNVGSMNQSPMNLSQASNISNAMRSGTFIQAQAAFLKAKVQNRSNILGSPQSNIGGIPGARQIHPGSAGLSMLGPALNRANINQMQRTVMGAMGPPKLMPGMNIYMNQQQQLQLQQQQQIQLQQQQQQQQQLQLQQQQQMQLQQQQQQMQQQQLQLQQETTSPLRAVVSPPPVGSPSSMGIAHQMTQPQQQQPAQQQTSPQQISQRTPMSPQLSSGAIHPLSTVNPEACPASPQVSSQTLGSVGSIINSPMELQGVNKSNSVNNA
ncbi:protein PHYTOCHROME-DEPENDENT LATE-FLOWERING-like [Primulina huaijiensis]|uniref:protein PHYTOCHROME-DEPENDENT LATE-FLOWERING-like n=1 Tax=Primulina huaijiensis TaxID=1492673 RepID=UPI003CC76F9A